MPTVNYMFYSCVVSTNNWIYCLEYKSIPLDYLIQMAIYNKVCNDIIDINCLYYVKSLLLQNVFGLLFPYLYKSKIPKMCKNKPFDKMECYANLC